MNDYRFGRINKFDRDLRIGKFYSLFPPLRNHVTLPIVKTGFAFTKGKSDGRGKTLELSGKGLFLGTLAGCGKVRNRLRLLNTLETMNTTELGSNVEV